MLDTSIRAALPQTKKPPEVTVDLPGHVRGKGRPRSRIVTDREGQQFVSVYTDVKTRSYEAMLRYAGERAMKGAGLVMPLDCALRVRVTAVFAVPVSRSRRAAAESIAGIIRPTGKPDGDNIMKCVGDSLNGVVWRDDSLVVDWSVRKFYGDAPVLMVEVWRWTALLF